ncbi:cellulose biosynthesis cyclic di-GMP-binding regulatory protein BcsB [Undibacterium sp. RTI2.1]|nr:cellulose biosynthesis cyclic di-GMP-binding regulatory protein BcsB [Undibacterium sp. RTI2.1]MEB0114877.1 cellulose biosynthesis cyclic di-GMP-binding regulatory protein BcsB [Undibacterium sp. RTI2.2]MEB0231535.1 cellulose biosynthesis cyclic di-GMP-binding regulatory protein BcsB [Undibacterium sp. 10I3]MEB0255836.1 cellulose biosynthesis cyclic di-GMP-binding regulatory protein BcsB [Undibacterium sp. 5I1]
MRKRGTTAIALLFGLFLLGQDNVDAKTKHTKSDATISESASTVVETEISSKSSLPQRTVNISLKQMGSAADVELRGVEGERSYPFTVRSDEIITAAKLKYGLAYSPALLPDLSHIKVAVNNELITVVPLPKETASGVVRENAIDPRVFADFNKLSFKLIGHYTRDCEDPSHSSLWANIGNTSNLELTVASIALQNDLALLPAPFFDSRDAKLLELPFIFSTAPSLDVLRNAGIVASWFGHLASYRGAKFPISTQSLPLGNAVVFATSTEAPAGITLPVISGPTLAIIANPANLNKKLLLVLGRNAAELKIAAETLALGQLALSGDKALIKNFEEANQRKPYDAPNWLPTDRPVKFGEMAIRKDLQVNGLYPDLIRINMRVAPDLFTWQKDGVPIDLRYRFTPRPTLDKSTLNVSINGEFIRSLSLSGTQIDKGKIKESVLLLFKEGNRVAQEQVQVPTFQIGAENQLQFQFFYDYVKQGPCKDVYLDNISSAIDPDSTIDFSGMPHYTAMPNLAHVANGGFPFTRMADLSETAIVMPERPSPQEIEVFLDLMGRMGESTGYPVTNNVLISGTDTDKLSGKDVIVIGTNGNTPLLKQWSKYMPLSIDEKGNRLQLPSGFLRLLANWTGRDIDNIQRRAGEMLASSGGAFGAMMQFESPVTGGRSVVVLTSGDGDNLLGLTKALAKPDLRSKYQGDLVIVKGDKIESVQIGDTYYVGSLPLWTRVKWFLSNHPMILIAFLMLASLIVATILFRFLRKKAASRLALKEGH